VLNGPQLWISNGREAEFYIIFATVDPAQGYRGITAFLVERDFPGFAVGHVEKKLGIRASSTLSCYWITAWFPNTIFWEKSVWAIK